MHPDCFLVLSTGSPPARVATRRFAVLQSRPCSRYSRPPLQSFPQLWKKMWKVNDFYDGVALVSLQKRRDGVINHMFTIVYIIFRVLISLAEPSLTSVNNPTIPSIKGSFARFSSS